MGHDSTDRETGAESTEWYWDLDKKIAVSADNRGPGDHTLGPYDSKAEAENWKATSARRNDIWESADDDWNDATAADRYASAREPVCSHSQILGADGGP